MTQECVVITLLSDDNTGIVEQVSNIISQHQGSWLDSRMARLSGKFAGIVNITIDNAQLAGLTKALKSLEGKGINIQITQENSSIDNGHETKQVNFELMGADRQGIVHEISQALSNKNINIVDMSTECSSMPWSGEPMFSAKGKLGVPKELNVDELIDQLDGVANQLGVDISLTAKLS